MMRSISYNKKMRKIYNQDIESYGKYLYTDEKNYSSYIATRKQTEEMANLIKEFLPKDMSILDIGCGDGTFTFELFNRLAPINIIGFDIAEKAISIAKRKIKPTHGNKVGFIVSNIYGMDRHFTENQFDIGILRGVLHHVDEPEKAIKSMKNITRYLLVLEPNGFNPILKVIEKVSPYHKIHQEKSYWPPAMENWLKKNSYLIIKQRYFGLVPYFCNKHIAKLLKIIEPLFENIPYLNRLWCSVNLTLYRRAHISG